MLERFIPTYVGHAIMYLEHTVHITVHPHIRGAYAPTTATPPPPPVHPHIRGAYCIFVTHSGTPSGSSPHTWGIPCAGSSQRGRTRFIPTYVGHTTWSMYCPGYLSVHPHIRGAYAQTVAPKVPTSVHPHIRGAYKWTNSKG